MKNNLVNIFRFVSKWEFPNDKYWQSQTCCWVLYARLVTSKIPSDLKELNCPSKISRKRKNINNYFVGRIH
jgi:hypothetical protein